MARVFVPVVLADNTKTKDQPLCKSKRTLTYAIRQASVPLLQHQKKMSMLLSTGSNNETTELYQSCPVGLTTNCHHCSTKKKVHLKNASSQTNGKAHSAFTGVSMHR